MKRRDFLRCGSAGVAGLALSGANLGWLVKQAQAAGQATGTPWKFGVMSDTQWRSGANSGGNPGTCAVGIINALNQEFIDHDCKFVVQVGDLVDSYTNSNMDVRVAACQALYDAGIGFFPVRGNHDDGMTAANYCPTVFPQTQGGGLNINGVTNVIPSSITGLRGLSYAFDVDNVRIVLIDQFRRKDNTGSTNINLVDQVDWVEDCLEDRPSDMHAFVMAHKNLAGQNHKDCIFAGNQGDNPAVRNRFTKVLQENKVGYYLGGHDHQHYRSVYTCPDGTASAEQIITASNSYKFYIPASPYDREKAVAHELFTVGYYIFTVDGPCVTVDFYSSSHGGDYGDMDLTFTPGTNNAADYANGVFNFYLRETFGYSLNGKSFTVEEGGSYNVVRDSFGATSAAILSGFNGDIDTDYARHALVKTVKTGWRDRPAGAASAVLKLWGIADNLSLWNASLDGFLPDSDASIVGDPYVLSVSYDSTAVRPTVLRTGRFCLHAKDSDGNWVNAVDGNSISHKVFVYGPWRSGYGLGTHGVDPSTRTVWAVLDRDGEFVARQA